MKRSECKCSCHEEGANMRHITACCEPDNSIDEQDIECYRNVHKSLYGYNPRHYPESYFEYELSMKFMDEQIELDKINNPEEWS